MRIGAGTGMRIGFGHRDVDKYENGVANRVRDMDENSVGNRNGNMGGNRDEDRVRHSDGKRVLA